MPLFKKKPVTVEAHRWYKNGDHPLDDVRTNRSSAGRYFQTEGKIVKYNKPSDGLGLQKCQYCNRIANQHGWISTLEGGHIVCPGDWIITGVKGEHYPCKPDIFEMTYEPAE